MNNAARTQTRRDVDEPLAAINRLNPSEDLLHRDRGHRIVYAGARRRPAQALPNENASWRARLPYSCTGGFVDSLGDRAVYQYSVKAAKLGGINATLEPSESISRMRRVIATLGPQQSGKFFSCRRARDWRLADFITR